MDSEILPTIDHFKTLITKFTNGFDQNEKIILR